MIRIPPRRLNEETRTGLLEIGCADGVEFLLGDGEGLHPDMSVVLQLLHDLRDANVTSWVCFVIPLPLLHTYQQKIKRTPPPRPSPDF